MRMLFAALVSLALTIPVAAPAQTGGEFPEGWHARVDRDQPTDQVKFSSMGDGFHATLGPAAVFYNPQWKKSGNYEVSARFIQTKAPRHPEAYGIIIGGKNLDGPDQEYSYLLVRGTGEYFVATRKGAERIKVIDWTAHEAVQKQDADGKQTNVLGAKVRDGHVAFTINGTEVAHLTQNAVVSDGIFGFRVNHNLDVHIDPLKH